MVREPQAYLMDEPLSNLDAKLRVGMRAELARLHDRLGMTTVYVTHDQVEAMTLGDRVAVLRDGTVQQCDTPERLFEQPGERVRRGVHGLAGDEPRATPRCAAGGCTSRGSSCRCRAARRPDGAVIAGIRPTDLARGAGGRTRRGCARSSRWSSGSAPRAT